MKNPLSVQVKLLMFTGCAKNKVKVRRQRNAAELNGAFSLEQRDKTKSLQWTIINVHMT